jgi:hypothetical protein
MKKFAALLVAVAFVVPAFAQNTTPQLTSPKSNLHIVAPAAKPLLLHTGRPLTQNDKRQFLAAVIKTTPAGAKKPQMSSAPPSTITLTPGQSSQGYAYLVMDKPAYVDVPHSEFQFDVGPNSNMTFVINAQPNTAYLLALQVNAVWTSPQFTIYTGSPYTSTPIINSETFAGSQGNNEFAYGVVSNSAGNIVVTIYSPNSLWSFTNCEITSTTF